MLLGFSLAADPAFTAIIEGFAAFGSVVAVMSAVWAFIAWGDESLGRDANDRITRGVNYGIVAGVTPAIIFAVVAYENAYRIPGR